MVASLRVFTIFVLAIGLCTGREVVRQKRDDLFGGLGKILNQLLGNNNNGNANGNGGNAPGPGPSNPDKQGPLDPNGKATYCEQNAADCEYVSCLAENFQHSEQSTNLKMGSKLLTDPQLRHALQTDPTVSQVACDKIKLDAQGCDGFKSFLGLIDKVSPGDGGNPHDPNRGRRSPQGGLLGTGVGAKANVGVGVGNNNGNNGNHNGNRGGTSHGATPSSAKPSTAKSSSSRPTTTQPSRPGNNRGGSGKGPKTIDYDIYDEHNGGGGHGSGSGSGAGAGPNAGGGGAGGYVPKDCSIYLPNKGNGGSGNGRGNGNGNGNNGNRGNGNRGNGRGIGGGRKGTLEEEQGRN